MTSCGWEKDYQLRLFKKEKTDLNERLVHEKFEANGEVGTLKNPMLNFTFSSFEDYLNKIQQLHQLKSPGTFQEKEKSWRLDWL